MADRKKVIKELENTEIMLKQAVDRGGEMSVMGAFKCLNHVSDALALLKEQNAKIGHWISVNDGDNVAIDSDGCPERACYCSECQKYLIASDEYAVYGRYCPYCGAKMEGRSIK